MQGISARSWVSGIPSCGGGDRGLPSATLFSLAFGRLLSTHRSRSVAASVARDAGRAPELLGMVIVASVNSCEEMHGFI